jgi:hypothetical protein
MTRVKHAGFVFLIEQSGAELTVYHGKLSQMKRFQALTPLQQKALLTIVGKKYAQRMTYHA